VNAHPRRSLFIALVACAVWLLVQEVRVVAFDGISLGPLSSRFAHDVVLLVTAIACLWRAVAIRAERTAWLLIGLGVLGWTFGEIYYTAVLWTESSPPIPSPADIGYLVFPLLTFPGMILLVRGRARFTPALLVDGIASALAVAALSAAIVIQTVLDHAAGGDLATVVTSLAYPVTDLVLVAVAVGALASTGWRVDRTWALLTGGILLFWFADSMYLARTAQGVYEAGGWFDAGWWVGLLMIALAAWQPVPEGRVRCAGDSLRLIAAPLASGAVALELLVYGSLVSLNPLAAALAAAALVFVMIRLTMTFRQNVGILRASRDEAMTDALTGLGNRRALTHALDDAFAEARDESPLVLALFDLDGFKHYNDTFGHPAGDVLLTRLGANLRKYLGTRGTVFRMGGDEFCALFTLHGQDRAEVLDGAALALSEHGEGFWIGCSYGSIAVPGEATDAAEALRIADQRMYAQKHAGRASPSRQVKEALLSVLGARDPETIRHARAVAALVEAAALHLGLGHEERETIRLAAELHEAGRLMLPHGSCGRDVALAGERIIAATPALAPAANLVGALHEHWDGTGFPDGLAGEQIPLGTRIVAVADAFETMLADRSPTEALSELQRGAGTQFDPAVVAAFTATASLQAVPFVLS
jgi:two-component system cell cycle response regulator